MINPNRYPVGTRFERADGAQFQSEKPPNNLPGVVVGGFYYRGSPGDYPSGLAARSDLKITRVIR